MFHLEYYAQERRQELLREAELYRLIAIAQSKKPKKEYSMRRWLVSLGTHLCTWGDQLQRRFGEVDAENTTQSLGSSMSY
jgi:hypothetical protein